MRGASAGIRGATTWATGGRASTTRAWQLTARAAPACARAWFIVFQVARATVPVRQRFDAKWRRARNGCWLWTAGQQHSYGAFRMDTRRAGRAHRCAWEIYRGPIPRGQQVLHTCDTPLCVNPEHLFLGTNKDNVADRQAKGRSGAPTGARHGSKTHPERVARGERSGTARLTAAGVREMRRLAEAGESYVSLGRRFGVSSVASRKAVLGITWSHV